MFKQNNHKKAFSFPLPSVPLSSRQRAVETSGVYGWLQRLSPFPPCADPSATLQHFPAAAGEQTASPIPGECLMGWRGWAVAFCRLGNALQ